MSPHDKSPNHLGGGANTPPASRSLLQPPSPPPPFRRLRHSTQRSDACGVAGRQQVVTAMPNTITASVALRRRRRSAFTGPPPGASLVHSITSSLSSNEVT